MTWYRAQQIAESQQHGQPLAPLVLAAVADLVIAEVPFHGSKRMLHFGPLRLGGQSQGHRGDRLG